MSSLYEHFKKYTVEAISVEDFCERYYKPRAYHDRTGPNWDYDGQNYKDVVINSHKENINEYGYTYITHHDSITGQTVAYYPE